MVKSECPICLSELKFYDGSDYAYCSYCGEKIFSNLLKYEKKIYDIKLRGSSDYNPELICHEMLNDKSVDKDTAELFLYEYFNSIDDPALYYKVYKLCTDKNDKIAAECLKKGSSYKKKNDTDRLKCLLLLADKYNEGSPYIEQNKKEASHLYRECVAYKYEKGYCYYQIGWNIYITSGSDTNKSLDEIINYMKMSYEAGYKEAKSSLEMFESMKNEKHHVIISDSVRETDYYKEKYNEYYSQYTGTYNPSAPVRRAPVYDARTGSQLYYNSNGDVVDSNGRKVSSAYWE